MNSDSEEKAVSGNSELWLHPSTPTLAEKNGALFKRLSVASCDARSHLTNQAQCDGRMCVDVVSLRLDRYACGILCSNFSSFRSEGRPILHCILQCAKCGTSLPVC